MIFNSFINSHIRYGICLWGGHLGIAKIKLNGAVKEGALRHLETGKTHTEPIRKKFKLMNINYIYSNEMNLMAWQFYNGGIPEAINNNILR